MAATTLAVVGVAIAAGTAAYQVHSAEQAKGDARNAAKEQDTKQKKLEKEAADQAASSEASKAQAANRARQKASASAAGAMGRSDTILTGPQGVANDAIGGTPTVGAAPTETKKTLLGV